MTVVATDADGATAAEGGGEGGATRSEGEGVETGGCGTLGDGCGAGGGSGFPKKAKGYLQNERKAV